MVVGGIQRRAAAAEGPLAPAREPLTTTTLAWLAVVPVAAGGIALISVLAQPLGRILFPVDPHAYTFLNVVTEGPSPEPTQHAGYLIALAVPAMFAFGLLRVRAARWRLPSFLLTALVLTAQLVGVAFAALNSYAQRHVWADVGFLTRMYFPHWALPAAVAFAVLVGSIAARGFVPSSIALVPRRRWEIGCATVVILITVLWLLPYVYRDHNLSRANPQLQYNLMFSADDILAVADGRSPLVNYIGQYTQLLPYAVAPVIARFPDTIAAFTGVMSLLTLAGFVCVHRVLRRVTGDPRLALALYVPIVAVSLDPWIITGDQRLSVGSDYAIFPMRYLGPFVLAWLCARYLDGAAPRRRFWLFALGGLVVLNNVEFGVPTLGAVFVALLLAGHRDGHREQLVRYAVGLVRDLVLGGVAAGAAVCALTLLRAGALPSFGYLTYYARTYAVAGFGDLPMPTLGFHLVVYMTFVGALLTAVVRSRRDANGAALTGMLAFSAIFGLGAAAYYANRSHPDVLTALFPAWGLAVSLLAWVAVRALYGDARPAVQLRERLRGALPALAVLVCLGLTASTVAGFPPPWAQIARIMSNSGKEPLMRNGAVEFVRTHARRGEHVLLLVGLGHDVARRAGVVNVMPFNHPSSMVLAQQLRLAINLLRAEHGMRIFAVTSVPVLNPSTTTQDDDVLGRATVALIRQFGYVPVLTDSVSQLTEWLPRDRTGRG